MNAFDLIHMMVSRESYIQALKTVANWCNGNLMAISRQRLNNIAQHGDPNYVPTVDTPAGEHRDEEDAADRANEVGHAPGLTLTQRGDLFASLRQCCIARAEELSGLTEFDWPRKFAEYIDARITGLRRLVPTEANIKAELANSIGITEQEAREFLIRSYAIQAGELEKAKEDLVSEDSSYETDIPEDEIFAALRRMDVHRMLVKVIDGLCYEVDRLQESRMKYPNFQELQTKRHLLLSDAVILETELNKFYKENRSAIENELGDKFTLVPITRSHQMRLDLTRQQLRAQAAAVSDSAATAASS